MAWLWLFSAVAALSAVLPLLFYSYGIPMVQGRLPRLHKKRICLLIAHPDDEAMFFAPTVLALTRPNTGNHVKILCLSSGNADGLGETRKKELVKSALTLGLRQEDDVFVLDDPDFPDSMTTTWDPQKISSLLIRAFTPHLANPSLPPGTARPTANIDVLVTFDAAGVSNHPNHVSLYTGARVFIAKLLRGMRPDAPCPVAMYTLTSVPIWRKYAAVLDAVPTLVSWFGSKTAEPEKKKPTPPKSKDEEDSSDDEDEDEDEDEAAENMPPGSLVFFSSLTGEGGLPTARRAMTTAHKSQMVWFRWGWITLSRYMVINDLWFESVDKDATS